LKNQGFPRQARIIKTDDFSSVFSFRKRVSGHFIVIHYQHNACGRARLGMVVAKKVAKRSVDRNYMRRVLREFFRKQQTDIAALDLVVRVQKIFRKQDIDAIVQEFDELLFRLRRLSKKAPAPVDSEPADSDPQHA
jgi:ribonuclease P protein component